MTSGDDRDGSGAGPPFRSSRSGTGGGRKPADPGALRRVADALQGLSKLSEDERERLSYLVDLKKSRKEDDKLWQDRASIRLNDEDENLPSLSRPAAGPEGGGEGKQSGSEDTSLDTGASSRSSGTGSTEVISHWFTWKKTAILLLGVLGFLFGVFFDTGLMLDDFIHRYGRAPFWASQPALQSGADSVKNAIKSYQPQQLPADGAGNAAAAQVEELPSQGAPATTLAD